MPQSWISRAAASAERSRQRIMFYGVTPNGHRIWDRPEAGHLVEGYPDYGSVLPHIPRRTRKAAHSKASRLKITRSRARQWDLNEIPRLRRHYPTASKEELLVIFPGRTYCAIAKAANSRGIYRAPRPLKPTGSRVLDQILIRARALNWTKRELGIETGYRRYYELRGWRGGRFNHRAHARAVAILGGRLRARFPDAASGDATNEG